MVAGVTVNPTEIYDDGSLYVALGLSASALARARRSGRLKFTRQGRRVFYLGSWIVEWLKAEGERREVEHAS